MNFIEISDGICLRKSEIVAVLKKSDGGSTVKIINGDAYVSMYSYETIKQLLEMGNIEEKMSGVSANSYVPPTGNAWSGGNFEGQHWRG